MQEKLLHLKSFRKVAKFLRNQNGRIMSIIFSSGWEGNRGELTRGNSNHLGSVGEGEFITIAS